MQSKFDLSILKNSSSKLCSVVGFSQVFNRDSYLNFGMMNENFMSWGCEDNEIYYRMMCLEYKVGRVYDDVYHLNHYRSFNSHYHNPKFKENHNLWQWFRNQDKKTIIEYYKQQDYLKERLS